MNWYKYAKLSGAAAVLALCSACASAPPAVDTNVKIDFPPQDRITSVEQADAVLELVSLSKAQIDWRYRQKEQICYQRFFVNDCLLDAKNERRVDSARVKKSEVEANYFKRRDNVEQMDKALEERNQDHPLADPDQSGANQSAAQTKPIE